MFSANAFIIVLLMGYFQEGIFRTNSNQRCRQDFLDAAGSRGILRAVRSIFWPGFKINYSNDNNEIIGRKNYCKYFYFSE